jgi:hypothetical protein
MSFVTASILLVLAIAVMGIVYACVRHRRKTGSYAPAWLRSRFLARFQPPSRPAPAAPAARAAPAPPANTTLARAVDNTLDLIAYACRTATTLDPKDVDAVIAARDAGSKITQAQQTTFWLASTAVAKAVAPVTIETLGASSPLTQTGESPAVAAARKYRHRTIWTLAALLACQIYWLIGATITSDIKDIKGRLESAARDREKATVALSVLDPKAANYQETKQRLEAELREFDYRIAAERVSASTNFSVLHNWNLGHSILLYRADPPAGVRVPAPPSRYAGAITATPKPEAQPQAPEQEQVYYLWEFTKENVGELQTSQITLTALLKYILPILYGALGASAYIVRSLANELKTSTYSLSSTIGYQLRFYLGAVAGLSIAWFTSDAKSAENAGILQSLSPLALAFLAGYSVELLFSVLDRLVASFSNPERKAS